ncbi:precorrin-3B synthase [Xanthobacter sp. KR7-65]|uniref:precorrin-3B synthase n=1 Tax=Xanthobacter sp. KR7-65 TaxID=3156612 RepID=UPI0032B5568B
MSPRVALASPPLPPARRGACPAFRAPMETGDGLILRLVPEAGALSAAQLRSLAAATARFGNGLMEITARGSLQVRGLTMETVAPLQQAVLDLGITPRLGLAVDLSPLSGLDPTEERDARALAAAIGAGAASFAGRLGPKVSVIVDGGGAISLAGQKADVRLRAAGGDLWALSVGGSAPRLLEEGDAAAAALDAIAAIAGLDRDRLGRAGRATDLPGCGGSGPARRAPAALGRLPLNDGSFAFGIGLPFGAGEADLVSALADAAEAAGARDLRPAAERVLLATGLSAAGAEAFAQTAQTLGCLVRGDDPRAFVSACAGAPACACGHFPARAMAPALAESLAPLLDGTVSVHLSACTKGCAHPAPATLAVVGMDGGAALVHDGPASGAAGPVRAVADLAAMLARLAAAARHQPGETARARLARLDPADIWARGLEDADPTTQNR